MRGNISKYCQMRDSNTGVRKLMGDTSTYPLNQKHHGLQPKSQFFAYAQYGRLYGHIFDLFPAYDEDFDDCALNAGLYEEMKSIIISGNEGLSSEVIATRQEVADRLMPTVHAGGDAAFDEFKSYHEAGANYIALGSKPKPSADAKRRIHEYRYRHNVKIHLFGVSSFPQIKNMCPDSFDSSVFAKATAFGDCLMMYWNTDDPEKPFVQKITYPQRNNENRAVFNPLVHGRYIREGNMPFEYRDLTSNAIARQMVNIHTYNLATDWLTQVAAPAHRERHTS
jgi:hypothetical protein